MAGKPTNPSLGSLVQHCHAQNGAAELGLTPVLPFPSKGIEFLVQLSSRWMAEKT